MESYNSSELCNILFNVDEIKNDLDAHCVVLKSGKNYEFLSYYYKKLVENNTYEITPINISKGNFEYNSQIESDSLFYLRDLGICSFKINESKDKISITFTLNENYKEYFSKFYEKKLKNLEDNLFFSKKEKDIIIYSKLVEKMKEYEKFFH
jgi:hypothetical protein